MPQKLLPTFVDLLFRKLDPEKFQESFLEALTMVQRVERGSIWVKQDDRYLCTGAVGEEADKVLGVSISHSVKSIVGDVIKSGEKIIAEPGKGPYFRGVEDHLARKNSLVLCFPLSLRDGTVYGAVQILDTTAGGRRMNLDPDYLELLEGLVAIGGIALSASLELADQQEENRRMRQIIQELQTAHGMLGQSQAFQKIRGTVQVYASNDFPVLITGESGTGKELAARAIHRQSLRRDKPFLSQNCSAIPDTLLESELFGYRKGAFTGADRDKEGLFAAADGGTLFLDEIGDMPLGLQAKILHVLQSQEIKPLGTTTSRRIDVRIIAATNRNLEEAIGKGAFREDLFYRLNVLPLHMPPLRERKEEIPLLLNHFLKQFSRTSGRRSKKLDADALEKLTAYPWPGNIREMENLVKYLLTVAPGETIHLSDLPPSYHSRPWTGRLSKSGGGEPLPDHPEEDARPEGRPDGSMAGMERSYILSLLEMTKWNVTAAAKIAGLRRTTLTTRMKKLGISRKG
ncbi:MAG: sigma-54-dependent Fis family transcriptional regulator [Proteobacteria bacterium]|nr:sigma-54-dependent Fis family transcriptional regulator [Pseudomonadota bacterium]